MSQRVDKALAAQDRDDVQRYEHDARRDARGEDGGDLGRRRRQHDGERAAPVATAPVRRVRSDVALGGQDVLGADDFGEPREQGCAGFRHGPA